MKTGDRLLTIHEASSSLGVHPNTVRRWGDDGTLLMVRTSGGHRRFPLSGVETLLGRKPPPENPKATIVRVAAYCRVSSHDQASKGDLERQVGRVLAHCVRRSYDVVESLTDVGSGMSDNRPRFQRLLRMVDDHRIDRVVVEHKDRLSRFGVGLLTSYFGSHGVTIEWVDETLGKTYEEELVADIVSLMSSFSARLYGRRSAENRRRAKTEAVT